MTWLIRWYCAHFHGRIMWAGGRTYECTTCFRRWPVAWERPEPESRVALARTNAVAAVEK